MQTKICTKCRIELNISMFNRLSSSKDGYKYRCRKCEKEYRSENKKAITEQKKMYIQTNNIAFKERNRKYKQANKDTISKDAKEYYETNKSAIAKRSKKFRDANKEIMAERGKKYYKENKDKIAEKAIQYRELNKNKLSENHKQYYKNNRSKAYIRTQKRLAKKKNLPNTFTFKEWVNTKLYFNNRCAYCGKELPLAQEHFIALSRGGGYTVNNIIPSCKSCNSSKGNREFKVWYPKYKYYSLTRQIKINKYLGGKIK